MAPIKGLSLEKDEEIQKIYRRSWWLYFWGLFVAFFLFLLPFFLIFPLFSYGWSGIVIFGVVLVASLWLILRLFLIHQATVFILTNLRLINIEQRGLLKRVSSAFLYDAIRNINVKIKDFGAIIGVGDLEFELLGKKKTKLVLSGLRKPQEMASKILALQEMYLENGAEFESVKLLQKIKDKVGEEEFKRLISD